MGFSEIGKPIILDVNLQRPGLVEALRQKGFNIRSVGEIFGRTDLDDASINVLADRLGAKVLTRDRGREIDGGFWQNAIQVDSRLRSSDEIARFLEHALRQQ